MVGTKKFAESFITSEWLFQSLDGKKNFDYTSVISGYLKSIEQLLYEIVIANVDNGCKISLSGASEVRGKAYDSHVKIYKEKGTTWQEVPANTKKEYLKTRYPYIDLTANQVEYMDRSMGTFAFFFEKNPRILVDKILSKVVADMVRCFGKECRNGYFHTHNLNDWSIVEKTRSNAIYLYFILLGGCIIPQEMGDLGIRTENKFDILCQKIREVGHYNPEFIFEYDGGRRVALWYDYIANTVEYTDDGVEQYTGLLFYEVDTFSSDVYERMSHRRFKEQSKIYLTKDNIPHRIWAVCQINENTEEKEIFF